MHSNYSPLKNTGLKVCVWGLFISENVLAGAVKGLSDRWPHPLSFFLCPGWLHDSQPQLQAATTHKSFFNTPAEKKLRVSVAHTHPPSFPQTGRK